MSKASQKSRRAHARVLGWSLAVILIGAMVAPLSGYLYVAVAPAAYAQQTADNWEQENPRADTWGSARRANEGYTSASGPYVVNELIINGGENWRNLRNGPVASIMPWFMAASLLVLGALYLIVGPHELKGPLSGRKVKRWAGWERAMHWFVAVTFIILAITGLSLLFGRAVLIPLLGYQGFSVWAEVSKWLHNVVGPFFTVGVLLMLLTWVRNNIFTKTDLEWFKKGGGIFTGKHVSAGKLNGGEKAWYWFVIIIGLGVVCTTGLILDFPNFGQSRETMQIANLLHAVLAILWIAISFGHIYLGVIGAKGALEGMTTGYVSEEWAREHHDEWLDEIRASGQGDAPEPDRSPAGGPAHGPAAPER
ncbi:MAG: formate dehydrogenase subunit gamma [Halofilum sp. (in: g-proteobacteria)]|nr:formate dehydrogenase subunit gamma [Halofilum sp. (in: g-proteobacteria)]